MTTSARKNELTTTQAVVAIALTGAAAIGLGLLVYATERDLARSSLIPNGWRISSIHLFGNTAGWLPGFLHSFAFSLFTAAALWPCRPRVLVGCCAAWATIDGLFELGQHPDLKMPLASLLVRMSGDSQWGTLLARYFAGGRFDLADIVAAVAGAILAAVLLLAVFNHSSARHRHG